MPRNNRILLYKLIAIVCTVVLCSVQLIHIRNIYKLENQVFLVEEKKMIRATYNNVLINDKVYPGGVKIIDKIIYRNFDSLAHYAKTSASAFKSLSARVCDTLFTELRDSCTFDSVFKQILLQNDIQVEMVYALFVDEIAIAPKSNQYHSIFDKVNSSVEYTFPFVANVGAKIGGSLTDYSAHTLTSGLSISTSSDRSYRLKFTLYCDRPDRLTSIIWKTLPQTMLSVFSIFAMLIIYFFTFSNWTKQKKESEMKSDFINTITHEFQTPLTAVIIANKTIEQENEKMQSEKVESLTNIIKRQTERLSVLITQVIETSGDKPIRLRPEQCRLGELLHEIVSDYQMNIGAAGAVVLLNNQTPNDWVFLDKLHFTSIVLNILDNGIKYNRKEKKEIIVSTSYSNPGIITLSIRDNGDGMSRKVIKNVFEKFYRNPSMNASNEPGIGLGLYYTRQCLEAHKWEYEIISKGPGMGSEFLIYMPVSANESVKS